MGRYIRLRDCKLVRDEIAAYSILLARANGLFNGRRIVGVEILKMSNKTCEWNLANEQLPLALYAVFKPCAKPAALRLICTYGDAKFAVYLCMEHFERLLRNAAKMVETDTRRILETVKEAMREGG
jgi:hypothetical protein